METISTVWVFNGARSSFPSAVFANKEDAVRWVKNNQLTGTLTEYPIGISVYDYMVSNGKFAPHKPEHSTPDFIARFSSAYQEHYHYENGEEA